MAFLTNNNDLSNSNQILLKYMKLFAGTTFGDVNGVLSASKLNTPYGVNVDKLGNVYSR